VSGDSQKRPDVTLVAHWPNQDVPCCEEHARQIKIVGESCGLTITFSPCEDPTAVCANCESEAKTQGDTER